MRAKEKESNALNALLLCFGLNGASSNKTDKGKQFPKTKRANKFREIPGAKIFGKLGKTG